MKTLKQVVISAVVALGMAMIHCGGPTHSTSPGEGLIEATPNPAIANARFTARVNQPEQLRSFQWVILAGGQPVTGCSATSMEFSCLLSTTAESMVVSLDATRVSDSMKTHLELALDVLHGVSTNQAPVIIADLVDQSDTKVSTFATFPQDRAGSAHVMEGLSFSIVSRSYDPENNSFTQQIDLGEGRGFVPMAGSFSHTYQNPGTYSVTLKATDSKGNTETINTLIYADCDTVLRDPISISSVNITPASPLGFFNYQVNASGGVGALTYNINADGDAAISDLLNPVPVNTPIKLYTILRGIRKVTATVTDPVCGWWTSQETPYNFDIPNPAAGSRYQWVAGDVNGINGYSSDSLGQIIVADDGTNRPPTVRMSYNPDTGILGVDAASFTRGPGRGRNGIAFNITNLISTTDADGGRIIDTSNAKMIQYHYYTGGQGDLVSANDYRQSRDCTVAVIGTVSIGQGLCQDGTPATEVTYEFDITSYACPELADPSGNKVEVVNGKGHAWWSKVDGCPPGGGGGGGGQPPTPR